MGQYERVVWFGERELEMCTNFLLAAERDGETYSG